MENAKKRYTTQLQAGLGLIEETRLLFSIYEPEMTATELYDTTLAAGLFPGVSARRLRNIITECFAPRYLATDSARYLKQLSPNLPSLVLNQFLLIFTCQANQILLAFIREIYWPGYAAGRDTLSTVDAKDFIVNAVQAGKTGQLWSDSTIRRVASYLIGSCSDYGLLSAGRGSVRQIQTLRLQEQTLLFFAYWLHFLGLGDNSLIKHEIWEIFGLEPGDVREELKRISNRNWLIVQSAGDVTRLSWRFSHLEEVIDVIIGR